MSADPPEQPQYLPATNVVLAYFAETWFAFNMTDVWLFNDGAWERLEDAVAVKTA